MRDAPLAGLYVLFYEQCKVRLGGTLWMNIGNNWTLIGLTIMDD